MVFQVYCPLTLPIPIAVEQKKLPQIFIFTLVYEASKGFMKALKRQNKKLIFILTQLSEMHGGGRL